MKKIVFFAFLLTTHLYFHNAAAKMNLFAYSRPAPETEIFYQDGSSSKLSDFKGNFVVAVFWSKTCVPCIRELKSLNKFYNKIKDTDIKVVMISPASEWNTNYEQREFLNKYKATDIDFFTDKNGNLAADFGIFSYPHTVLIDQDGEEIGRIHGQMDWDSNRIMTEIIKLRNGEHDVKK